MKIPIIYCFFFILLTISGIAQDSLVVKSIDEINSDADDISPVFTDSATLFFTSNRNILENEKVTRGSQNIYKSKIENNTAERLSYSYNSDNHDAIAGISTDRKTLFIYKRFNGGDIYYSTLKENGNWSDPKHFSFNTDFHETSATASDSVFFFTSDMPGGKGKLDIYKCIRHRNGTFSKPENMEALNSAADENFVFLSGNEKILYFSSNREDSVFNIYKSVLDESGNWSIPEKLTPPVNSNKNDICYSEDLSGNIYFASDRANDGKSGYDIFKLQKPEKPYVDVDTIASIPIVLEGTSLLETQNLARIVQIKDKLNIKCNKNNIPEKFTLDISAITDTGNVLFVSNISVNEKTTILDSLNEPIIRIEGIKKEPEKTSGLTLDEVKNSIDFDINLCKIQVGAFLNIFSVNEFEKKYPKLKGKIDMEERPDCVSFLLKETCNDLDCAAALQKKSILEYGSVPDTFIGVYDKNRERIVIFFDVEKNNYMLIKK